jgi:hypothetical protein
MVKSIKLTVNDHELPWRTINKIFMSVNTYINKHGVKIHV